MYSTSGEMSGNFSTESLSICRILKNLRALEIMRAMQSRRELKMPFEQRARFFEHRENFVFVHALLWKKPESLPRALARG